MTFEYWAPVSPNTVPNALLIVAIFFGLIILVFVTLAVISRGVSGKYIAAGFLVGIIFSIPICCKHSGLQDVPGIIADTYQYNDPFCSKVRTIEKPEVALFIILVGYALAKLKKDRNPEKAAEITVKSVPQTALESTILPTMNVIDAYILFSSEFARDRGKRAQNITLKDIIADMKKTEKYGSILLAVFQEGKCTVEDVKRELTKQGNQIAAAILAKCKDPYTGEVKMALIDNSEFHPKGLKKRAKLWKEGVKLSDVAKLVEQ